MLVFLQVDSCRITLSDVNHVIRRLLGSTYKGHGENFNTITRVSRVFLFWRKMKSIGIQSMIVVSRENKFICRYNAQNFILFVIS